MTLGGVLGIAAIVIFVIVLAMFPEARTLLKGLTRIFIQDRAATPDGARAIYAEKIEQLNQIYNDVNNKRSFTCEIMRKVKLNLEVYSRNFRKFLESVSRYISKAKWSLPWLRLKKELTLFKEYMQ